MKAYYYLDTNLREILHLPRVFVVVKPKDKKPEIILDIRKLKRRYGDLKRHRQTIEDGLIDMVDISKKDMGIIFDYCFKEQENNAEAYIKGIFQNIQSLYEEYRDNRTRNEEYYDKDPADWWKKGGNREWE